VSEAPIPSAPADLELIAQLKSRLQYAELRIRVLEEQLRLMRIEKYGAGGEKLSHAQMELFELEGVVSEVMVPGESERTLVRRSTNRSCKHPGRQELPASLPRVERVLPCTLDQRVCKSCGKETVVIGYEESSQLDVEPARYFVLVTKREKRACRSCEELGVVSAPLPPRIIEKCLASDRIVMDTVISKYCNHTPLYRQSMILGRDIRLEISRATLDGWVLKVGELLIPMVAVMRRELISGSYIQADETPVDVQMHEGRGKNHQAYLWQYSRPGGSVVFDFWPARWYFLSYCQYEAHKVMRAEVGFVVDDPPMSMIAELTDRRSAIAALTLSENVNGVSTEAHCTSGTSEFP
jgi:transposase